MRELDSQVISAARRLSLFVTLILPLSFLAGCIGGPQLAGYAKHGRETAVIQSLQEIFRAQAQYYSARGKYARSLNELVAEKLLGEEYGEGKPISEYVYTTTDVTPNTFTVHADRTSDRSGFSDFNITEKGDVYKLESKTKGTVARGQGQIVGVDEGGK
jgi:hypothetical protein